MAKEETAEQSVHVKVKQHKALREEHGTETHDKPKKHKKLRDEGAGGLNRRAV